MIVARRYGLRPKITNKRAEPVAKITPTTMGKLFVAILLIAVFEGAIRKWITPALTNPLVLLRDGLALYGLFWALKTGKMHGGQKGAQALWLWSALVVLWGLFQLMVNQSSPLVYVVGLRFWLLYLWFAYAAGVSMTQDDFRHITKTLLWLVLIMAPLAVVQFFLPPSAFLNKQLDGDEETVFRVTADIVRTTGTFSFTTGYTNCLAMISPFILSMLMPSFRFFKYQWMPKLLFFALAVATMVSGSRSALVMFGALFILYIFFVMKYSPTEKKGSSLLLILGVTIMLSIVPYIFSRAVDATNERFTTAAESENFVDRLTVIFFGDTGTYDELILIGQGLGSGTNFAGVLATGERTFLLAETEASRIILEGGVIGYLLIGIKIAVLFLGIRQAFFRAKKSANILPLMIWGTLVVALISWSIIGQLTINVLGNLLFGLAIASLRFDINTKKLC